MGFDAIFAEHIDDGRHIREYTDWKLIVNLSGAVAVILGGILVGRTSFAVLFYIMGALALISFFGILLKPRKLL